jgi:hypothetical protein
MLPGIEPTGRAVEIPTVAIVQFQEDKLGHEHIYWDQASVLVQLGLLNPDGLPIAGAETARKVLDVSPATALSLLRADPEQVKAFVEEILRIEALVGGGMGYVSGSCVLCCGAPGLGFRVRGGRSVWEGLEHVVAHRV